MTTLYGHGASGSTHRVRLLMHRLGVPHRYVEIDLAAGAHRQPAFLQINPFGQVPVLQDAGRTIRDSHAILIYLARTHGPQWMPTDPVAEAEVQGWLSLSAGEVQQTLGRLHLARTHAGQSAPEDAESRGRNVLRLVDHHLRTHPGRALVGDAPTLADVALFPYLSLALVPRLDLDLAGLDAWLAFLRDGHGFVPLRAASDLAA